MDAIKLLRSHHSAFRKRLREISQIKTDKIQRTQFKTFCKDLIKHETMEQKLWYPILRKKSELKDVIKHLVKEEKSAGKAIKNMSLKSYQIIWKLKFLKIKRDVNHHAKEEETKLFPKVRKYFNKMELNQLGIKMSKFYNKKS